MKQAKNTCNKKRRGLLGIFGFLTGLTNGFFGSGGGMIAVESMERGGMESKSAHASSILAILPLSLVSAATYWLRGSLQFSAAHWMLLGGAALGGILGALLLGKLSAKWVDWIFTALMLISGVRMVLS